MYLHSYKCLVLESTQRFTLHNAGKVLSDSSSKNVLIIWREDCIVIILDITYFLYWKKKLIAEGVQFMVSKPNRGENKSFVRKRIHVVNSKYLHCSYSFTIIQMPRS